MMQQPPMGPPPPQQPQQWSMMPPPPQQQQPPQYYQAAPVGAPMAQPPPPAPMWTPQHSQIPPPVMPQPVPQTMPALPPPTQQLQPHQQYQVPLMAPAPAAVAPPMTTPQMMQQQQQSAAPNEIRTLWIGDLPQWMDESYLYTIISYYTGEVISVKIIKNKQTQLSEGYGFIEFSSLASADLFLQTYNGQMIPNLDHVFKLNWAMAGAGERRGDDGADFTIFVGDLAADVSDFLLQETFKSCYKSVKGAKVVTDRVTQRSKGYGFVRFGDQEEQQRAMIEINGVFCSTRPMRIGPAANKKNLGAQQQYTSNAYQTTQGSESENAPNNTTIFVGGLDPNVTDDNLRQIFSAYGELVYVKIPVGKGCGFVQYANRANAEEALKGLQGSLLGAQNIRLSWGRSPTNKQPQQDPNQWNGGYYGYSQGYDAYGFAAPPQDPNIYAYTSYQGYGNYPQQQQQPTQ